MSTTSNIVREDKRTGTFGSGGPSGTAVGELIRQAAEGNFKAFGSLYGIYLDRIYRYVFYQVKDKMTAEDITEEVFVRAWKSIKSCRGREGSFQAWLYRIAHNHLIDCLRDNGRVTSLDQRAADAPDPSIRTEVGAEYHELLEAIAGLPETQRQVIILKFIEGLDNREVGKIMAKNEGAVRITQMRALASLRDKLGEVRREDGKQAGVNAG